MHPAYVDFQFTRGDDFSISVTFTDAGGTPQNISGWTNLTAQIRASEDADAKYAVTINTSGAATGVLVFSLSQTDTRAVPAGVWDLQRTSSGALQTVLSGRILPREDITR